MSSGVYRSFTLSDDAAVESILTDIPLFCIGVFSIGVFTFLVAIKRVDLLLVYLFISSFLGFVAAILDLGQILIRGHTNAASGLNLEDVAGFIRGREVLLSVSLGVAFLLWWTFVGLRPVGIPVQKGESGSPHCAEWTRWGYVGLVLKWASLVSCLLIFILELVWRLAPKHHKYGGVYVACSTLEITISVVFILKIFLNFYLTPSESQRRFLLSHIAPIVALLVGGGVGAGNLVLFTFSETALGRFLRAIEVYILLVYFLVAILQFPPKTHRLTSSVDKRRSLLFTEKSQQPQDPHQRRTDFTENGGRNVGPSMFLGPWRPNRGSTLSKVSSWLSGRRFSRLIPNKDPEAPWPRDKEVGIILPQPSLLLQKADATKAHLEQDEMSQEKADAPPDDIALSPDEDLKPPKAIFSTGGARPLTELSLSYYAMEGNVRSSLGSIFQDTSSTIGSNSPIYGLDGIIPPRRGPAVETIAMQLPAAESRPASGVSHIDDLLQRQSELDRSISVLKGLHNRQNSKFLEVDKNRNQLSIPIPMSKHTTSTSFTTPSKPSSASGTSDFSLSNFPEPPRMGVRPPSLTLLIGAGENTPRRDPRAEIIPIQIPGLDIPSEPVTPSQFGGIARFASAGTQYDVTSFIEGPNSGYASTMSYIPSSSLDRAASPPVQMDDEYVSPTSSTLQAYPPGTTSVNRGLGKATMSSSFKDHVLSPVQAAKEPENKVIPERKGSLGLRPSVVGGRPARVAAPSGPRQSKASSGAVAGAPF